MPGLFFGAPALRSGRCQLIESLRRLLAATDEFVEASLFPAGLLMEKREFALVEDFEPLIPGNFPQRLLPAEAGKVDPENAAALTGLARSLHNARRPAVCFNPFADFLVIGCSRGSR